jgi:hypothetical protein
MIFEECLPLSQHDILDAAECSEARDLVMELRPNWTTRSAGTFFTLGAASYLDAVGKHDQYVSASNKQNRVLRESFEWLHERVRSFFEDLFEEPVFFQPGYALPGFHIFTLKGEDRSQDNMSARAHFDLQWMHAIPGIHPHGTMSFTLPIEEPSGGASMAIWHVRYNEALQLGFSVTDYASKHTPQIVNYARGRVVIHDGFVLHAIGKSTVKAPTGLRITLQGHGVRLDDGWLLYW